MPLISTFGAMSSRGFGEFAQQTAANYIEDVFSTYLYTGNSSTQTINNGIDLSTKGGMIWFKVRPITGNNNIVDTVRGISAGVLRTNLTNAQTGTADDVTSFNTNGYSLGYITGNLNDSPQTYVSWTFRKQPKFFDIVTWTGNGTSQNISHNLGSVPGFIIVKNLTTATNWATYHRSLGAGFSTPINSTSQALSTTSVWDNTAPTATQFTVGSAVTTNEAGSTFIAYLFAHDAGGFGADGSQNVISCGSFTTDGSGNASVTLGYEPQYVLIKTSSASSSWYQFDNMRGMSMTTAAYLSPNNSNAEASGDVCRPSATGFSILQQSASTTYIYMAIRRGPMRTPTDATKVFAPVIPPSTDSFVTNFPVDLSIRTRQSDGVNVTLSRLQGNFIYTRTYSTDAETSGTGDRFDSNTSVYWPSQTFTGWIGWLFRRAPGFFDVVCYTGTGSSNPVSHNLGVVPELIINKSRNNAIVWVAGTQSLGKDQFLTLNTDNATSSAGSYWGSSWPTSSTITYTNSGYGGVNASGYTYVSYLFATCPGVSKVGTYTGTGATQTISCGFTGGARYVLIKRTDDTGSWWVWDTARGMVSGTDPRLAYNSTAAETNANWVYTTTGGFQIVTSDATVNASGGTYIYLAIA